MKTEISFLRENAYLSARTTKQRNSYKRVKGKRSQLFCDHCKRTGYTIEKCYKLDEYPNRPGGIEGLITKDSTEELTTLGQKMTAKMLYLTLKLH